MMDAFVFSVDDKHWNSKELERFVALVRADEREIEREACAKVADLVAREIDDTNGTATYTAAAIRARGNT
jgi:hypothetical protein